MKCIEELKKHPRSSVYPGKKKAIMIGGTGATGKKLLSQLLGCNQWAEVTTISRRPVLDGEKHEKLKDIVIDSFDDLDQTKDSWIDNDIFFNCIGTTRKLAGSAKAFVDIEFGISLKAAELAHSSKIPNASVISSGGADSSKWAVDWIPPLLYMKTIGQKEDTLTKHFSFKNVTIFRPGMLIRNYNPDSFFHRFCDLNNLGLRVDILASAMRRDAEGLEKGAKSNSPIVYIGNKCIKSSVKL